MDNAIYMTALAGNAADYNAGENIKPEDTADENLWGAPAADAEKDDAAAVGGDALVKDGAPAPAEAAAADALAAGAAAGEAAAADAADETKNADNDPKGDLAGKPVEDMSQDEIKTRLGEIEGELAQQQAQKTIKQAELDKVNKELEEHKKEFEEINEAIEKAVADATDEQKSEQKKAINNAMASYDQEKDGDWNAYLKKSLAGALGDSQIEALIGGLSDDASKVMSKYGDLQTKAAKLSEDIGKIDKTIGELKAEQLRLDPWQDVQSGNLSESMETIKGMVSAEEWALVEENDVDLAEKMGDGSPRYIIANGKSDGKPHIYDMQNGGATLARQYACDQGFDIIECGNGYMYDYQEAGDDCPDAETITFIGDCGGLCTKKANYQTCSPLSFDLNGDGVKTSDKEIQYDIDGDGVLDTINDSADAVLVFDKDGDGIVGADGSETFGNNTDLDGDGVADGYKDGFEALKALAQKEGLVDGANDNKLDENDLKLLHEKYGLSIKTDGYNGKAKGLDEVGITEINLAVTDETTLQDDFDGNGNQLMTQQGATFTVNGETREYADIWHKKQNEDPEYVTTSTANNSSQNEIDSSALSFNLPDIKMAEYVDDKLTMTDAEVKKSNIDIHSIKNPDSIQKKEIEEKEEE